MASPGPHASIPASDGRERFLIRLFDRLWIRYRERVPHVGVYERLVAEHGGRFVNDHIAFRTLACERPRIGVHSLSRIFQALGYEPAGCYTFPGKHLNAIHYQHPNSLLPKLFISELRVWELPANVRQALRRAASGHRPALGDGVLSKLVGNLDEQIDELLETVAEWIEQLPWPPPDAVDLQLVESVSQYGAWVMVHGYNVNHYTSLINSHGVPALDDIEKTVAALKAAGVPMKATVEGERGSKLRQSATEAARIDVAVQRDGEPATIDWTYAYFELAERGDVDGCRFEGFLGPQASQLFEMTRRG